MAKSRDLTFQPAFKTEVRNWKPTGEESSELKLQIGSDAKDVAAYEDIFRSLLNSTEFAFNH